MMDPLQYATIEKPLQMGLEECLFLLHRHRQHLETYRGFFLRLKEHLNVHVLSTCRRLRLPHPDGCTCSTADEAEEKREIAQQVDLIAEQHVQVTDLHKQINVQLLAIAEIINYLAAKLMM